MKVAFVSLGCAKNLVNTEQMMALCRAAGYTVTGEPEGADVAVVNTCGFIDSAKSEAIQNILELAAAAKERRTCIVAVTKYGANPLAELADFVLPTSSPELEFRSGAMSSRIASRPMQISTPYTP